MPEIIRRWTVAKSCEGEWMSFDLYGVNARLAQLTYHHTHSEAMAATCRKIKQTTERSTE